MIKLLSLKFLDLLNKFLLILEAFMHFIRKCSIAKVTLISGLGNITINGKTSSDYFQGNPRLLNNIVSPLALLGLEKSFDITVSTLGGGLGGQADAILRIFHFSLFIIYAFYH